MKYCKKNSVSVFLLSFLLMYSCRVSAQQGGGGLDLKMRPGFADEDAEKRNYYQERHEMKTLGRTIGDIKLEPGRYVAIRDVHIPEGARVEILSGARIFCEPGVSINVAGELYVHHGVQIRNVSEALLFAETGGRPAEWKGMSVGPGARLTFMGSILGNSHYGIKISGSAASVNLESVAFDNISGPAVLIDGADAGVAKGPRTDFAFPLRGEAGAGGDASRKTRLKIPFRISFGLIAAGGLGAAIAGEALMRKYNSEFLESKDSARLDFLHEKITGAAAIRTAGMIAGSAGAAGFVITFFF